MAIAKWKVAIEDLGLPAPRETEPPDGRSGKWFDAQTRFARRGFARILVREGDELTWFLDAAHPAFEPEDARVAKSALERSTGRDWSVEAASENHFQLEGHADPEDARTTLVPLLLIADAMTADRDDLGDLIERLKAVEAAEDADGDEDVSAGEEDLDKPDAHSDEAIEESTDEDSGDEDSGDEDSDDGDEDSGSSPFESIGDDEPTDEIDGPIFDFAVAEAHVELGIGLAEQLDPDTFDRILAAWSRSLRGRYDVRTDVIAPDAERQIALPGASARLMLRARPDALEGSLTVEDIAPQLRDHIDTLQKISDGGIDPLVFLGVRERSESRGASDAPTRSAPFETIGGDGASDDGASDDTNVDRPDTSSDESDETTFLVADDDDAPGQGMVLDLEGPPSEGSPLRAGRFDDPRLDAVDATTPLVDVVLRHPGYSDRNIGQVLSILLSIDYSDALELANDAPRVIAWGVGNDRAQTMKTVIEGAGGKVHLVEPDTFAPR